MGLQEDIKEIKQKLQEQDTKKPKEFKIPFGKRVGAGKKKQNYVTLIKINENSQITFKKVKIVDQTFIEDDVPRLASAGYVLFHKKNPVIILPSWSVEPFSPLVHYNKSLSDGSNSVGYPLLMARMKKEQISSAKPMGNFIKWALGIGLLGIILYAIFFSGG